MSTAEIQYVSDASGAMIGVIVPIGGSRKIAKWRCASSTSSRKSSASRFKEWVNQNR